MLRISLQEILETRGIFPQYYLVYSTLNKHARFSQNMGKLKLVHHDGYSHLYTLDNSDTALCQILSFLDTLAEFKKLQIEMDHYPFVAIKSRNVVYIELTTQLADDIIANRCVDLVWGSETKQVYYEHSLSLTTHATYYGQSFMTNVKFNPRKEFIKLIMTVVYKFYGDVRIIYKLILKFFNDL